MKTTMINLTTSPANATVHYSDYTYGKTGVIGSYQKNVRTGKMDMTGNVPVQSLQSREDKIKRMLKYVEFSTFNYRWDELEGIISITASGENFNVNVDLHDDYSLADAQDDILNALESAKADDWNRISVNVEKSEINIRLWGDHGSVTCFLDDTGTLMHWLQIIGIF